MSGIRDENVDYKMHNGWSKSNDIKDANSDEVTMHNHYSLMLILRSASMHNLNIKYHSFIETTITINVH